LLIHHRGDCRMSPWFPYWVNMLLCMTTCHINEVWLKLEIQNGRQEAVWAWKRCTFFICSGFYKHGQILSKFGMQVSIGYVIIENENRVTKIKKFPPKIKINIFFLFFTCFRTFGWDF
jgi:hypothetical protein